MLTILFKEKFEKLYVRKSKILFKALFGQGYFERKEWKRKELGRKDVILPCLVMRESM